jgi:hypothetical protein
MLEIRQVFKQINTSTKQTERNLNRIDLISWVINQNKWEIDLIIQAIDRNSSLINQNSL